MIFQTLMMDFCAPVRKFQMKEDNSSRAERATVKGENCWKFLISRALDHPPPHVSISYNSWEIPFVPRNVQG